MTVSAEPPVSTRPHPARQAFTVARKREDRPLPWLCLAVVIVSALASTATAISIGTMAVVFVCSILASIAGFAFSALAGAVLFHVHADPVQVVGILLVSSLSGQVYTVWSTRHGIDWRELAPYVLGGVAAVPLGVLLLLNTRTDAYLTALGCFLIVYGAYTLVGPPLSLRHDSFVARCVVGMLGGLTGALAAFPAAFVVVWCRAHDMDRHRQLAIVQPFILIMQATTLAALVACRPAHGALSIGLIQFVAPAILGAYGGLALRQMLTAKQFNGIISIILLVSGLILASRGI